MKGEKRKPIVVVLVASVVLALGFCIAFLITPSSTKGGSEGEQGRKKNPDEQGLQLGALFGDQWIIVRDLSTEGNGKPIYFTWQWPDEAFTDDGDFEPQPGTYPSGYEVSVDSGCVQPVSFEKVLPLNLQFELNDGAIGYYDSYGRERVPTYLIPLDPECKIPDVYADSWGTLVMETDSGRYNMARSPQDVLDASYEEVLATINRALSLSLDPAGRLVLELESVDESGASSTYLKTIDAPLENLALYQRVMKNGCLAATDNVVLSPGSLSLLDGSGLGHLVCGDDTAPDKDDFLRAASFLAGGGDKTGRINVDLLIYLNNRLEVNDLNWSSNRREVSISYFNFIGASYDRSHTHLSATANLLQPPAGAGPDAYPAYFDVASQVSLYDKVFTDDWPDGGGNEVVMNTPIVNFVRAADDALVMINYLHNYELPTYPVPPVVEPSYPVE